MMNYIRCFSLKFPILFLILSSSLSNSVFCGEPVNEEVPRIALLQISPVVTDYSGNANSVIEAYRTAVANGATMVVTPELVLPGYPAADLLVDRPEVLERSLEALEKIRKATMGVDVPLIVGHLDRTPGGNGRKIQNTYSIFADGKLLGHYAKMLLPTYGIFDESRYFEPGEESPIFEWKGKKYIIQICEDGWFSDDHDGRLIYKKDPLDIALAQLKAGEKVDAVIYLSASPYTEQKRTYRHQVHQNRAKKAGAPVVWVNQIGATDGIVFDGSSFVLDSEGELVGAMQSFPEEEQIGYVTLRGTRKSQIEFERPVGELVVSGWDPEMEVKLQALLTGLREYFGRTGQVEAVLGLSGGIDSSVTAALAVLALGADNVTGISMPSKYSPDHANSDAALLAKQLGLKRYFTIPIEKVVENFRRNSEMMQEQLAISHGERRFYLRNFLNFLMPRSWATRILGELSDGVADENLQARARAVILYNYANQNYQRTGRGTLVLTTGCKSELAMGWCTKFGDHAGDYNPVGDLLKTKEIEMGHYINARQAALGKPPLIPEHILRKAPSPDLKPNQLTAHTLPPYDILDPLIEDYETGGFTVAELTLKYGKTLREREPWRSEFWVQEVIQRLENPATQVKRDTAPPITRITRRHFSPKTRRIPVARATEREAPRLSCDVVLAGVDRQFERRTARP